MVRLGARSGYAIKKATDISTRQFFPISLAQIYPELARLEEDGYATRRDDPHGRRARSEYTLTDQGEEALLSWLRSKRFRPPQFRDENVLRIFFADALPLEEQIELLRRLGKRAGEMQRWMQSEIVPAATVLEEQGLRHPRTVAQLGSDLYGFAAKWLEQHAACLEQEGREADD